MPILTKRWCDAREPNDGFRLLVCRYRPRALAKKDETWDAWWPELGPSRELHAAHYGKDGPPLEWKEYERRFLGEMPSRHERLEELARRVAAGERVTLLCSSACRDARRCHRTILAEALARATEHCGPTPPLAERSRGGHAPGGGYDGAPRGGVAS